MTGLYEVHKNLFNDSQINFFYGFGGHLGIWNGKYNKWFKEQRDYTVLGIDGILGIDYIFDDFPLNLSLDWKPGFNIIGYTGFWGDELAISARIYF